MPWIKDTKRRVTLAEIGYPDLYIDFRNPATMKYGDIVRMEEIATDGMSHEDGERVLVDYILDWNLTDNETDSPLPLPTKEDLSPFYALPLFVMMFIRNVIQEMARELNEETPKKVSEIPLEAVSKGFAAPSHPAG